MRTTRMEKFQWAWVLASMFIVPGLISSVCLILGVSLLVQMKRRYLGEGEDAG